MEWTPSHLTRAQMEERRRRGGRLLQAGKLSQVEIARQLGVSRATVSTWTKHIQNGGLRQLRRRKATGRPAKLTGAQQKTLLRRLKRGALAAGCPTDRWTLARIQQLIETDFGVGYHPNFLNAEHRDKAAVGCSSDWAGVCRCRRIERPNAMKR